MIAAANGGEFKVGEVPAGMRDLCAARGMRPYHYGMDRARCGGRR